MIYDVEFFQIPETYVRISMKTKEFDKLLETEFSEISIIYRYRGSRYLFMDDDFVVEELVDGCSK